MKDQRVTVRLSAELRGRLKDAARRRGTQESIIVREAVERQFALEDAEVTLYDHARKLGLIGMVRGAAHDLSTNPKHMDGFGKS